MRGLRIGVVMTKGWGSPLVWGASRIGLGLAFGLSRRRRMLMKEWGLLSHSPSIIESGRGRGPDRSISDGPDLGVDLDGPSIEHAEQSRSRAKAPFRCVGVTDLLGESMRFDLVLMIDFLQRIQDRACVRLLRTARRLAKRYVLSFEPIEGQNRPTPSLGSWIVNDDRGDHMRPRAGLFNLVHEAGLELVDRRAPRLGPIDSCAIPARGRGAG